MDVKFLIDYLKHTKNMLECEGAKVEIILGEEIVNEICDHLMIQRPSNYKDIHLFGSLVHVDFMNVRIVKICKVFSMFFPLDVYVKV